VFYVVIDENCQKKTGLRWSLIVINASVALPEQRKQNGVSIKTHKKSNSAFGRGFQCFFARDDRA